MVGPLLCLRSALIRSLCSHPERDGLPDDASEG